jgi:hypothetical protein
VRFIARAERHVRAFRDAVPVNDVGDNSSTRWIARGDLLGLVEREVQITGDESPEVVLTQESNMLVAVTDAAMPALDLHTYRVRLERREDGQGPRLTGMREFVHAVETLTVPTRAATVSGKRTTYTFLLDASVSRVLAGVAVDDPSTV